MTCEDIALRRQQVRQKLAELAQQQEREMTIPPSGEDKTATIQEPRTNVAEEEVPVFIAFARVFSGTLRKGQELYVLGPKYDPHSIADVAVEPDLTLKVKLLALIQCPCVLIKKNTHLGFKSRSARNSCQNWRSVSLDGPGIRSIGECSRWKCCWNWWFRGTYSEIWNPQQLPFLPILHGTFSNGGSNSQSSCGTSTAQ